MTRAGGDARRRVLQSFAAVLEAALAASLAWAFAHDVLGHTEPFFAPIAAAISLSTSYIQRSRRIAQMIAGVLLGIGVAELAHPLLGSSTLALGITVLTTMVVALALGAGFFGDGMMFPNQAAVSAVLVVTVHRHGTGAERAIDVLVGGVAALLVGVLVFPSNPVRILADAEGDLLCVLAERLGAVGSALGADETVDDAWTLGAGHDIHRRLSALNRARATARLGVRTAPRRWHLRRTIDAEVTRTAQLDLLANAVISLIRAATLRRDGRAAPAPELRDRIASLAADLGRLAIAPRPWAPELLGQLRCHAEDAVEEVGERRVDSDQVVAAILRATARDLIAVTEPRPLAE
ncbi:MAG: FUSC family protein [Solirubrobacterales bacterium]|nr:FUSC family protein [Solirubrobacterales bacterium]